MDGSERGAILIVDDSPAQRRLLRSYLRNWEYPVLEATGGEEALEICATTFVEIVISDWMMPGMDGLELCRQVRGLADRPYTYYILLTSKSEKVDIARGLDVGADDFLSKPVATSEFRARMRAGERILAMQRELRERNRMIAQTLADISTLYESLDNDLQEARSLQQSLVPETHRDFGAGSVSLLLQPSGHIGGDLVGFINPGGDHIGMFALDVSGHGVASAMLTARLAGHLTGQNPDRNVALEQQPDGSLRMADPSRIAARLNALHLTEIQAEQYFTLAMARICLVTGQVKMTLCGHPGYLIQKADGSVQPHILPGFPVGMIEGVEWEDFELSLNPGERLLFMSDGVTEYENQQGAQLELEGLVSILTHNAAMKGPSLLKSIVWDLSRFGDDADFADDISAALFEFKGTS